MPTQAHEAAVLDVASRTGHGARTLALPLGAAHDISAFLVSVAEPKEQNEIAERVYLWAVQLNSQNHEAWNGLGRVALQRKQDRVAFDHFGRSLACKKTPAAYVNAAEAMRRMGDLQEASHLCNIAAAIDPAFVHAHIEQAAIQQQFGGIENENAALRSIELGLALDPENAMLHYARSCIVLARGEFAEGWPEYEYRPPRLKIQEQIGGALPEWEGEPLTGKRLLVVGEQGIGDQIQFARYIYGIDAASIVLFIRPELARLFSQLPCQIVTSDREVATLEPDYWIAIGSLPIYIPLHAEPGRSYLSEPANAVERFRHLIPNDQRFKVGLVWAGNPEHQRDSERSLRFEQLRPILDIPGCAFYSFQHGATKTQQTGAVVDLDAHCHDFADIAAAMASMDLIISVDTAALHLAGALGVHAWGLIYEPCDWRWDARQPAPWYASVTALRQTRRGDWDTILTYAADSLRQLVHGKQDAHHFTAYPAKSATAYEPIRAAHTRYGPMSYYRSDKWLGRSLELYGEWSESEARLMRALLHEGDTVIEVGANIGALTLPIAQAVGTRGHVYAFEPQAEVFDLLVENTDNCDCILTQSCNAITHTRAYIYLQPFDPINPGGCEVTDCGIKSVRAIPIDDMDLQRLNFLKADCEGSEAAVLRGAERTLARCRPYVYVENDRPGATETLVPWLRERGYRVWQHLAPLYNPNNFAGLKCNVFGSIVSAMLLAVPKERALDPAIIAEHALIEFT